MIHNTWWPFLQEEWKQPYFQQLSAFLHEAYATKTIFPPKAKVFSAFEVCDYPDVKVVILGQDPYHEVNQAHGMCFSVNPGVKIPHANKGWEIFTDHTIQKINEKEDPVVFMLWGRNARNKASMIDLNKHLVLECAHPSPLSAYHGFFGCRHFSQANAFLVQHGKEPIHWQIENL